MKTPPHWMAWPCLLLICLAGPTITHQVDDSIPISNQSTPHPARSATPSPSSNISANDTSITQSAQPTSRSLIPGSGDTNGDNTESTINLAALPSPAPDSTTLPSPAPDSTTPQDAPTSSTSVSKLSGQQGGLIAASVIAGVGGVTAIGLATGLAIEHAKRKQEQAIAKVLAPGHTSGGIVSAHLPLAQHASPKVEHIQASQHVTQPDRRPSVKYFGSKHHDDGAHKQARRQMRPQAVKSQALKSYAGKSYGVKSYKYRPASRKSRRYAEEEDERRLQRVLAKKEQEEERRQELEHRVRVRQEEMATARLRRQKAALEKKIAELQLQQHRQAGTEHLMEILRKEQQLHKEREEFKAMQMSMKQREKLKEESLREEETLLELRVEQLEEALSGVQMKALRLRMELEQFRVPSQKVMTEAQRVELEGLERQKVVMMGKLEKERSQLVKQIEALKRKQLQVKLSNKQYQEKQEALLRNRVEQLTAEVNRLKEQLQSQTMAQHQIQSLIEAKEKSLHALQSQAVELRGVVEHLQHSLKGKEDQLKRSQGSERVNTTQLEAEIRQIKEEMERQSTAMMTQQMELKSKIEKLAEAIGGLKKELETIKARHAKEKIELEQMIKELRQQAIGLRAQVAVLKQSATEKDI